MNPSRQRCPAGFQKANEARIDSVRGWRSSHESCPEEGQVTSPSRQRCPPAFKKVMRPELTQCGVEGAGRRVKQREARRAGSAVYTLHPTPYTPYTSHPTTHTLHPEPYTLHPTTYNPSTLQPHLSALNPRPSTGDPQTSPLNPQV